MQATQLYAPYGGVRYSSGTMPTDYGFTGQHSDTTTGLDYYGARYYDPLAGQFTSADTVLPGDDPWSLSRYAYVAGNPLIRLDPTGHCWVVCAIVHAVTHAVKAAVKVVAVVADTTLGISSMISDAKIIFSGKTNFFQKVLAVGDLSLNAFMDVTTVVGIGEGMRAGYLGVKVAGKVGLRALGKFVVHDGEDAVAHVAEHELADVAERGAEQEAEHAAESCALSFAPSTLVATPTGQRSIASLKVGDAVAAYDPTTGKASVQTVQHTFINHDSNLLAVTLRTITSPAANTATVSASKQREAAVAAHGALAPPRSSSATHSTPDETIQTTTNHPWLTADHGWILASFLRLGEPVQGEDGSTAIVVAVKEQAAVCPTGYGGSSHLRGDGSVVSAFSIWRRWTRRMP